MTSLAASRRQNDGARRVTFSESRATTSSRLYDSEDEEEEERRREQEEEEEERALSERFGEAEEGGDSRKRKKEESEKDIAQELDQEEKKKAKRQRPQLLPSNLTDVDGLIKIPIEFKRIKYKPKKGKKRDVVAAASYCQNLIKSYRSFCDDLFPSMAFEDVLLKIEQLGSKKEVKTFLQNMRDNLRNEYLVKLYGSEKAERMIQELNDGLKQEYSEDDDLFEQQQPSNDVVGDENEQEKSPSTEEETSSNISRTESRQSTSVTPDAGTSQSGRRLVIDDDDDDEQEATFEEENVDATVEADTEEQTKGLEGTSEEHDEFENDKSVDATNDTTNSYVAGGRAKKNNGEDDDDEEEATFEDDMQEDPPAVNAVSEKDDASSAGIQVGNANEESKISLSTTRDARMEEIEEVAVDDSEKDDSCKDLSSSEQPGVVLNDDMEGTLKETVDQAMPNETDGN